MPEIIIADDHFAVRIGVEMIVRELLGRQCLVDFANDGVSLLDKISSKKYDMVITDMNMPNESGLSLLSKMLAVQSDLKIIVLTVNQEEYFAKQCLITGAYAFVNKAALDSELKEAIRAVSNNRKYISDLQKDQLVQSILNGKAAEDPFNLLSEREKEIALLFLKGMGVLEVANTLALSQSTASTFKARIFKKLDVRSIVELNNVARKFGFITDESIQY